MIKSLKNLPFTIIVLGTVSFFNDLSSEMIYPLLPLFLSTVLGAGPIALGTIEGFAEAVASLLKISSGMWADRIPRRKPLMVAGYTLSSLVRPLIGLAASWYMVFFLRIVDRAGKGIRTSPRDALIADVTPEEYRGSAYGFHRSMDHAGAVLGPLVAMFLLALGFSLRSVFLFAFIPAIVAVALIWTGVREKQVTRSSGIKFNPFGNWKDLGSPYHRILLAILIFTLGNSTDAFILLRLSNAGVSNNWIAGLWAIHHIVKMISTVIGGWMSDRAGRRTVQISGWFYYSMIYLSFALITSTNALIAVFILYGIYYGLTEPTERAWVADLAPKNLKGEAFGWYNGTVGLAALPASILFGAIWSFAGYQAAFITGALLALLAAIMLFTVPSKHNR